MDEFEKRLKVDAANIRVEVSPELQRRLDASMRTVEPIPMAPDTNRTTGSLWLASSLTGLAAAVTVIVLLNWNRQDVEVLPPVTVADTPVATDEYEFRGFPLNAQTADLTEPLEEELQNLQADLEKARQSVAKDLRTTF